MFPLALQLFNKRSAQALKLLKTNCDSHFMSASYICRFVGSVDFCVCIWIDQSDYFGLGH